MVRRIVADCGVGKQQGKSVAFSRGSSPSAPSGVIPADACVPGSSEAGTSSPLGLGRVSGPRHFLQLVILTGTLAAVASVCGKIAFDFGPDALVQRVSDSFLNLLFPPQFIGNDRLFVALDEGCGYFAVHTKPPGFIPLLETIWKAVVLIVHPKTCTISNISDGPVGASATAFLSFCCLVLLVRVCLFGCMLACNALMLQCHVKCLVAAPSAGSSSIAVFAANFLCSVLLSWLLLDEKLTLRFVGGAACMLVGVGLLSYRKP